MVVATGRRNPDGSAHYESYDFAELDSRAGRYAAGLQRIGITRGTRTVLMVTPGREFFALVFALYRVGAVLVLIDPGIEKAALKQCLREVEPEAFVGVPLAHVARIVFGEALATVRILVTVGKKWFWGGSTLDELLDAEPLPTAPTRSSSPRAPPGSPRARCTRTGSSVTRSACCERSTRSRTTRSTSRPSRCSRCSWLRWDSPP